MASSLRIPRVEVFWGDVNLTFYNGSGSSDPMYSQPLVYNVSCNLTESGQSPTGSMNWNPSGAAYKVYEKLLREYIHKIITVRYYYLDGRSISFAFLWAGQEENYGKNMDIRVVLSSELDGLINGNIKSTGQSDETGVSLTSAVAKCEVAYGVDKLKLVDYTKKAKEDMEKALMVNSYSIDQKFYECISGLAENNGNLVFASNIITSQGSSQPAAKCIVYTPYAWDKDTPVEELGPTAQAPDPKIRYGYILGPNIIETITKNSQWQPAQKRQFLTTNTNQQLQSKDTPLQGAKDKADPQKSVGENKDINKGTVGSSGTVHSNSQSKMRLENNQDGYDKNLMRQEEHQCRLSTTLFMCPVVTGIKPYDIIFIPNYSGTFMEDWIVTSVEYSQTNGGVNVSVQASRKFALGDFMNPTQGQVWLAKAKSYGLVGENPTLENWMKYAWKPGSGGGAAAAANTSVTGGTTTPAAEPPANPAASLFTNGSRAGRVSGFTVGENSNIA